MSHSFQLALCVGPTPPPQAGTLQQTDTWLAATNLQQTDVGHVPYGLKHPGRAASCNQFVGHVPHVFLNGEHGEQTDASLWVKLWVLWFPKFRGVDDPHFSKKKAF